jgi:spoIIIJ-associated protein
MAPSLEFEARNVEKAINAASKQLKKSKENLKYEIISYGSTGIFGLVGIKKAKIRVTIPENKDKVAPPVNTREKESGTIATDIVSQQKETLTEEIKPNSEGCDVLNVKDVDTPEDIMEAMEEGTIALKKIIGYITQDAEINVDHENEVIGYQVSGGDSSRLIGKRGQTLEAIQYLLEKIVNQKLDKRIRVRVDIEDYLKNKEIKLIGMAEKLAGKAKKTGKPVSMGQLNAHDRRIVHIALKNDTDVRTQSRGQSFYRKLIIFPKNKKNDTPQ